MDFVKFAFEHCHVEELSGTALAYKCMSCHAMHYCINLTVTTTVPVLHVVFDIAVCVLRSFTVLYVT